MVDADARDQAYWQAQTPAARLRELERLRQLNYNYGQGKPLPRLQRILKIAELEDLRTNKAASGRQKDLADLEALENAEDLPAAKQVLAHPESVPWQTLKPELDELHR